MKHFLVIMVLIMFVPSCTILAQHTQEISDIEEVKGSNIFLAEKYYRELNYKKAIERYKLELDRDNSNKARVFKKIALSYAGLGNAAAAEIYVKNYFVEEFNPNFLDHEGFDGIRNSPEFIRLTTTFLPKFNAWWFLFIYITFVGIFVAIIINFNKRIDFIARIFISTLIFTHSLFILHLCIYGANYQYKFPHALYLSSGFAFLYGPLLYLYLKRITLKQRFSKIDLLHFLPTLILLGYLLPSYLLSSRTKLNFIINGETNDYAFISESVILFLVSAKLASLIIYGFLIQKLHFVAKGGYHFNRESKNWLQIIYQIHLAFILVYIVYAVLTINGYTVGFLYHLQLLCMSIMVLFLGYSAYIQPDLFSGVYFKGNRLFKKYETSMLTKSLSIELKDQVTMLFEEEKIYRENSLTLDTLAEKLNTTRHSTSRIINENFKMNFNELVNIYRIEEAKELLLLDKKNELNIIDIVYKVGFNNKVSFSRAFKKHTKTTPSQYRKFLQSNF
ncbi:helix-turn-helix domain-containing protein [Winogradskyella sp. R77965]|uniref:helix-turn-helix domain-containing protein n=1 Tax=Winogradskyella sp. R77965 TaxID=3093872 RepID=UPI0037DC4600